MPYSKGLMSGGRAEIMQDKLLYNKKAIITGCNRGIGLQILTQFATEGADIYACARSESKQFEQTINDLTNRYGVTITPVYFDMLDEAQIKQGIQSIIKEKTPIDILVNNAGVAYGASFQMTPVSKLKEVFEVNYFAQIQIMQLVSRVMMRQRSGSIINMASVGGIEAEPGYLAYGSSKAALIWATRCLAKEMGAYNVRVNAIAPGLTETDMGQTKPDDELQKVIARTPLGRMAKPEEIAEAVMYLASDRSSYITGQIIQVDGGRAI